MDEFRERSAPARGGLPPPGETVVVQCEGFQCLAYRDESGKWFEATQHQELFGVKEVISHVLG